VTTSRAGLGLDVSGLVNAETVSFQTGLNAIYSRNIPGVEIN
jgi:hypothetical protein